MCHTDLEINQTEKQQRERERKREGGSSAKCKAPSQALPRAHEDPKTGSLGSSTSLLDHMLDKYLELALQRVCVRVCKAPKQMAGDVRLRQTIDFRKQISSLVKHKAPLGPREGRREGGMGRGRVRRRLSNLCHRQLYQRKPGEIKRAREERKTAPIELHYCAGKEREEKRGEWRKRGEDNGVNASRQAAAVLG